uniref:Uncharacterized protein n=1 Tax=Rhipicephalus appendiculatus TaxID=34631 RepID=A0A131Z5X2_RHIAP
MTKCLTIITSHSASSCQLAKWFKAFHGMQEWESIEAATGKALSNVHAPLWQWPLYRMQVYKSTCWLKCPGGRRLPGKNRMCITTHLY